MQSRERFHTGIEASQANLEGRYITRHSLVESLMFLGLCPESLRNKTVLNFGCGSTNFDKELKEGGIDCRMVNLDLVFDPWDGLELNRYLLAMPLHVFSHFFGPESKMHMPAVRLKRQIAGIEDRVIIQNNGRRLPFADETFEKVLAFWSTYQIPYKAKETVYEELMRVSDSLHLAPIFGVDLDFLLPLADKMGFGITGCWHMFPWENVDQTIYPPTLPHLARDAKTANVLLYKGISAFGAGVISLQRENS